MALEFKDFTNLYSLSKTLRFELRPVGETLANIERGGLLNEDEVRAEDYKQVKKLIDEYHKEFIERVLAGFELDRSMLREYAEIFRKQERDEKERKRFDEVKKKLREQIVKALAKDEKFARMFKQELIKQDLPEFLERREGVTRAEKERDLELVKRFDAFTTYFVGFHENRKNMYSAEEQSTAIANRLVAENLPKFLGNVEIFKKVAAVPELSAKFPELYAEFESEIAAASVGAGSLPEMFTLAYFGKVLTQRQIDLYNAVLGGRSGEGREKRQGLNELVNLYNQQHKEQKLPKFKSLFKQILSDHESLSWLPEAFLDDGAVLKAIREAYAELSAETLPRLRDLLLKLEEFDCSKIFLKNDADFTAVSQKAFGHWDAAKGAILAEARRSTPRKGKRENDAAFEERLEKLYKDCGSFSLGYVDACTRAALEAAEPLEAYFKKLGAEGEKGDLFERLSRAHEAARELLEGDYPKGKNLVQEAGDVEKLRELLDLVKDLQRFVKPLLGSGDEPEKDERFYGDFVPLWERLDKVTPLYNMVRNYMTKKPYSSDKMKLNFGNSTLANGWDLNKESDNTAVILRKGGLYYLAIMDKKHNKVFDAGKLPHEGECYEKMVYKQTGDMSKNVQNLMVVNGKTTMVKGRKETSGEFVGQNLKLEEAKCTYLPAAINEIRKNRSYSRASENFKQEDLAAFIDYYKERCVEYYDHVEFHFKKGSEYRDLTEFTDDIKNQAYSVAFTPVSVSYISGLVSEGKVYLFQIYNKDFSPHSHGTPNIHTLYWRALFSEENLKDVVYQLNGGAEVFYRKRSITCERPTHPRGEPIKNKNPGNPKRESVFDYDLVKDRRYTVDKFFFHVPITLNFKARELGNINERVNEFLAGATDAHIIGIDRGERHLLYLVMIDLEGRIVKQCSLNVLDGKDYRALLDRREAERLEARRSWRNLEGIKELKEGYLSQVVHQIAMLVMDRHAAVVLEDLNPGFMRGRQKVEKAVYQKFEKALIDKLNCLVSKQAEPSSPGGILRPLQLTNKFESFKKMGKQNGLLLYVPAWNTSKIDPATGFVNLFDTRYTSVQAARAFFESFDSIAFNRAKNRFEFKFDYDKFTTRAAGTKTRWTVCTNGERLETFRNPEKNSEWDTREVRLTAEFRRLFEEFGIEPLGELKQAIVSQGEKQFFERLLHLFKLTLQMRNSVTGTEVDYLVSPVEGESGGFFDGRTCPDTLPKNADANGAYNIALKGLMAIRQIKQAKAEGQELKKLKFDLSNKAWLNFAQQKPYLNG